MGSDHAGQAAFDGAEGLLPGDLAPPAVVVADHRGVQPVGILVEGSEAGALGADEALGEGVVGVALDRDDVLGVVEREPQAAHGLAEGQVRCAVLMDTPEFGQRTHHYPAPEAKGSPGDGLRGFLRAVTRSVGGRALAVPPRSRATASGVVQPVSP
nr:hypothetical protein GCM10020093_081390 [Planobispora longispora]